MGCLESLKVASWLLCWGHQVLYDYVASIYIISSWDLILWLYLESDDCWILSSNTYLNDHVLSMTEYHIECAKGNLLILFHASKFLHHNILTAVDFFLFILYWLIAFGCYYVSHMNILPLIVTHYVCPHINLLSNFNMI